jgi:hypothetical protein
MIIQHILSAAKLDEIMLRRVSEMRLPFLHAVMFPLAIMAAACLLSGCGGTGLRMIDFSGMPMRTVAPAELISEVNRNASSVRGVKGKLELGLEERGKKARRCSGMLIAMRPPGGGLRIKGYKRLLPTFFTLVSDGGEFWLHIPRDDVVYTGPVDFSWSREDSTKFRLNARDIVRALFVAPVEPEASWDVQNEEDNYVVTVHGTQGPARKLWIERKGFHVIRETYYDRGGSPQLEIERRKFAALGQRMYPSSFVLRDPASGSSVFLDFGEITLDPENVPGDAFRFRIPDGAEVKPVSAAKVQS